MSKQAVLLIHGIGEQRPMDTLRGFVETVWTSDTSRQREHGDNRDAMWSKPYDLATDFELRRLTTPQNRAGIRTDFFEFYWAHLMQGTQVAHVVAWTKTLLLRRPSTVPRHLRLAYWTLVVLVVVGLGAAYFGASAAAKGNSGTPVWLSLLISAVALPTALGILIHVVGDAARYLHVAAANVQCRHEIRAAGVKVLQSLHERGYDRIIVVGHSLGSVIGYDILNHAWAAFNADPPTAAEPSYEALAALEAAAVQSANNGARSIAELQATQRSYFNELRANGARWRVSDFVTLGSPLAHAEILLAREAADLETKFENREFPRCPPVLEQSRRDGAALQRFSYESGNDALLPHHAAVFAPVRWTNLYFPNRLLAWGDLVGGELRRIFGAAVRDVPVRTRLRLGIFTHTLYWNREKKGNNQHVTALRDALDLLDSNNGTRAVP